MGWLDKLLGVPQYSEVDLPAVRIHPMRNMQVLDLRAIAKPDVALTVGLRVAIEMIRTLPAPFQRSVIFAPSVTRAFLELDAASLRRFSSSLRSHIMSITEAKRDVLLMMDFGGVVVPLPGQIVPGDVSILVPPELLARAREVLAPVKLYAAPDRGLGSAGILDTLGPPARESHYTIELPMFAPDLVHIDGVPGIVMRWKDKVLLDLRRIATGTDASLATSFLAAGMALKGLAPYTTRTWILAPWQLGESPADALRSATPFAREAIAIGTPEMDRVIFDGEPSEELVAWVRELGLHPSTKQYKLTPDRSMPYPQLAQNLMLDYAVRGR
jgi:hypothetical protein